MNGKEYNMEILPVIVDSEEQQIRYRICESCEFFRPKIKNCSKCGCFMEVKTRLKHAKCPVGFWEIEELRTLDHTPISKKE